MTRQRRKEREKSQNTYEINEIKETQKRKTRIEIGRSVKENYGEEEGEKGKEFEVA